MLSVAGVLGNLYHDITLLAFLKGCLGSEFFISGYDTDMDDSCLETAN